jgi:iron complex transport system ATP-binding protein
MTLKLHNVSAVISSDISLVDIELEVEAGGVTAVIGPNGAGKTSLLRAICSDLALSGGVIKLNDKATSQWDAQAKAMLLAILPQRSSLEFPFTVEEVVAMGRIPHSTSNSQNRDIVNKALALVDCNHLVARSFINLSGGEKQRVQLARVAAQVWDEIDGGERCLILDEPTASLDLAHQEMIVRMFNFFAAQGVAILVVLHDLNLAAKCANQILVLKDGHSAAIGTPETVLTEDMLKEVFSISAKVISNPVNGKPMVVT